MTAPPSDLPVLHDPQVPADHVLGDGARAVLDATFEAAGATVERSKPVQTTYYPGRSLTVMHRASVAWSDGRRSTEEVVLTAGRTAPAGALTLSDGSNEVVVWKEANDPWLPGLVRALDPQAMATLLDGVGLSSERPLRCHLRAYRPGRRAVVEVTGVGVRVFLKVVKPSATEALHRAHELLASHGPVPHSLGWSPEHGIVVLQALPGRTLREALLARFGLPGPAAMAAVLDRLPAQTPGSEAPVDWRAREFGALLSAVAPELQDRLERLAAGLDPFEERARLEPVVAVHGDFYEAQLLVDGGTVTGLLDVDTYGPGRRVHDLATMIGHLSVLAIGSRQQHQIERYAARLLDGFDQMVDPALLRAAVAGVVLGLATGSFRVLEPAWRQHTERRMTLAEHWLASADHVQRTAAHGERTLTPDQSGLQARPAH